MLSICTRSLKAARSTSRSISANAATYPPANAPPTSSSTRTPTRRRPEPTDAIATVTPSAWHSPEGSPVARHSRARPGGHGPSRGFSPIGGNPWRPSPFDYRDRSGSNPITQGLRHASVASATCALDSWSCNSITACSDS